MPKIPKKSPQNKIWGLHCWTPCRSGYIARVICPSRTKAIELFSEYYDFEEESVREIPGLQFNLDQGLEPNSVECDEW